MSARDQRYIAQIESLIEMNPGAPRYILANAIYSLCPLREKIGTSAAEGLLGSRAMVVLVPERDQCSAVAFYVLRWVAKRFRIDARQYVANQVAAQNHEAAASDGFGS